MKSYDACRFRRYSDAVDSGGGEKELGLSADLATRTLAAWLEANFADAQLSLDDAAIDPGQLTINLRLVDLSVAAGNDRNLRPSFPGEGTQPRPLRRLELDYFISVQAPDPFAKHRVLGEVALALLDHPVFAIEPQGQLRVLIKPNATGALGLLVSTSLDAGQG